MNFDILVAKCGKSVGLKGYLKLIIYTDFIYVFKPNTIFLCNNRLLTIESFNRHKNIVKFVEINTIDEAKSLTSFELYTTKEITSQICKLENDEFFWFDIIGLAIIDNGIPLGIVYDIERIGNIDYLVIQTYESSILRPKQFLLPYIDRYVIGVDLSNKKINTKDALEILETS